MIKLKNTNIIGWIICILAAVFYYYEYILRMVPSVMAQELMHELHVNATQFGILSACFLFVYAPMQLIVGPLSDFYGPKKIITLAIITCTLGSYIFGSATTLKIAAIGRALIGFGSAFAFVSVLKLAASWLPMRFFALFVGLATTLGMLGGITGAIVLGDLTNIIGWRQTINAGTIAGIILTPIIWLVIKDNPKSIKQLNSQSIEKTPHKYYIIFVGLAKILKNPQMWLGGIIGCLMYSSLSLFADLWGIKFLTTVYNLPAKDARIACSMVYLGWIIGGPIIGYVSDILRLRKTLMSIGCLLSLIFISLVVYFPQLLSTKPMLLYSLLLLFGIFSSFQVLCFALSAENNPRHLVATASAFTNSLVMFGGITFQPLVGKLLDLFWVGQTLNGDRIYSTINNQLALTILPLSFFIGFILTFWLRENNKKTEY